MEYRRHPLSNIFPEMNKEEMDRLVKSMETNGFDPAFPIIKKDNQIIDGWNRYQAAKIARVRPKFIEYEGKEEDVVDFVVLANASRRHLTAAAVIQSTLKADSLAGRFRRDAEIAKELSISPSTVTKQRLFRVHHPSLADDIASRKISTKEAERRSGKEFDGLRRTSRGIQLEIREVKILSKIKKFITPQETANKFIKRLLLDRLEQMERESKTNH